MKSKFIQLIPALLSTVGIGFSRFSLWCTSEGHFCYRGWSDQYFIGTINPLYFFALYSLPLAIVLIFVRRDVFNFWVNPAIVILVVSLGFIATTPVSSAALISITRDDTARICACVFSAVSALLIMRKYYTLHSGHPKYFS